MQNGTAPHPPETKAPERRRFHRSTVVAAFVSACASLSGGTWANGAMRSAARTEERVRTHTEEISAINAKLDRILEVQQQAAIDLALLKAAQQPRVVTAGARR